jgi:hypothetical protein
MVRRKRRKPAILPAPARCITEFQAQGLELDAVLLAWGTDFIRKDGIWSNNRARGYKRGAKVRSAKQLRTNAYRVLLTRGRDGTVVFIPSISDLDETASYLAACGFRPMHEGWPCFENVTEKLATQVQPDEKRGYSESRNPLVFLVGHEGFEPSTSWLRVSCSTGLS